MKKIAITGGSKRTRSIVVHALSLLTDYPIVRTSSYSNSSVKYGIHKDISECTFKEMFVFILSSFTERIAAEQYYDKFISDGSTLNEAGLMETFCLRRDANERVKNERFAMCESVKKIASDYAKNKYDLIIHIQEDLERTLEMDGMLQSYFKQYNISVLTYEVSDLLDSLNKMSGELNMKISISPKNALDKALTLI